MHIYPPSMHEHRRMRLEDCERRRDDLLAKVARLNTYIAALQPRPVLTEQQCLEASAGVQQLTLFGGDT